ncbi:hypothetical protein [Nocardia altamirensis]|uniref:hypothetical protein n=1 Tax=Nocardia altamirensis TaxID=472158 RepID=UPI00084048CF|nr:hypothetical protein [Nocardia altamirensis]
MSTENHTPDTDLDDPFIARYADKVADSEEALLRADFARMREMRDNMAHVETEAEIDQLGHDANLIEERWSNPASDERENWEYLADAYADWKHAPATMRRFHDQVHHDRANGWDPLTPVEWRSQLQARELTGHGAWPGPERTSHTRESADDRGVITPTNPAYYQESETDTERQLRADYAQYREAIYRADYGADSDQSERLLQEARDIAERWDWDEHESRQWCATWRHLHSLTSSWQIEPERMRALYGQLAESQARDPRSVDPIRWRNYRQSAELTGYGTATRTRNEQIQYRLCQEEDLYRGALDSDGARRGPGDPPLRFGSAVRARTRDLAGTASPPPSAYAPRARAHELGQPIPGHAFAGLVNAHDREGVEW